MRKTENENKTNKHWHFLTMQFIIYFVEQIEFTTKWTDNLMIGKNAANTKYRMHSYLYF